MLIIIAKFWTSYYKIHAEPHCVLKYGQFAKHRRRPFIQRFPLVYFCVSCTQSFGVLTAKFLVNQITTHKMASLENIFTRLRIIVLCYFYLVIWYLSSKHHFGAVSVKFSLNSITTQKMIKTLSDAS